jgi:hypothetical protein
VTVLPGSAGPVPGQCQPRQRSRRRSRGPGRRADGAPEGPERRRRPTLRPAAGRACPSIAAAPPPRRRRRRFDQFRRRTVGGHRAWGGGPLGGQWGRPGRKAWGGGAGGPVARWPAEETARAARRRRQALARGPRRKRGLGPWGCFWSRAGARRRRRCSGLWGVTGSQWGLLVRRTEALCNTPHAAQWAHGWRRDVRDCVATYYAARAPKVGPRSKAIRPGLGLAGRVFSSVTSVLVRPTGPRRRCGRQCGGSAATA